MRKKINTNDNNQWPSSSEEGELAIDLYAFPDEFILQAIVGGAKAKDLDISITNDMITIKGKREEDISKGAKKIYYQELFWGPFSRTVVLPEEINADLAKATIKNGLLTIHLPRILKNGKKVLKIQEE